MAEEKTEQELIEEGFTEEEITEKFLEEYEKLRIRLQRDFAFQIKMDAVKVNIPKNNVRV